MRTTPPNHLHNLAFLLGLTILGLLAWQGIATQQELLAANDSVTHRLQRITAMQDLRVSLQDIETGERGFVITGNEVYLTPYTTALTRLPSEREVLEGLSDNASTPTPNWFAELDEAIARRLEISAANIATRRADGAQAAADRLMFAGGRQIMDRLRQLLDDFERHDRQRLVAETREANERVSRSIIQAAFGVGVVVLLFLTAYWFLDRNLRIRRALTRQAEHGAQRLRALLDAVPDTLFEIDGTGIRRLGRHADEPVPRDLAETLQRRIDAAEDRKLLHGFNWQDRGGREYEIRILPTGDATHLAIVRDVTETQRTRRRLHDQQLFLRNVVDADESAIFVRDAKGRFVLCNNAFAALIDCAPAELEGRLPEDVERAGVLAPLLERDAELLAGADEVRVPAVSLIDASGKQRWLQLLKRPLTLADDSRSVLAVAVDISERLRVERMKGEFVSTISHELRTPLTAIRGALGMIRSGIAGPVEGTLAQMIDIADKNSERLVRLINDVLDIEKLESGRLPLKLRDCRLRPLLAQAVNDNGPYASGYGVRLELAADATDAPLRLDPDRFAQIMANLLSNAVKHSPEGAVVTVGARRAGKMVEIDVTDHGSGIPAAFHNRVFDRFAQADGSDVRRQGGTGLGLAITRSLVDHMGGDIGFDTVEGEGTRFHMRFPPLRHDDREAQTMADERLRILMIESDHAVAEPLVRALEEAGHAVIFADSIVQARRLLKTNSVHALTLNPAMPDEDSLTFLRELRSTRNFRHLPVLMLGLLPTAADQGTDGQPRGGALGIVDWVTAPDDPARLVEAVRSSLARSDARAEVLHVEDDADLRTLLASLLPRERIRLHSAANLSEARAALNQRRHDLVILDLVLPDGDGGELLPELARSSPPTPVIVFSAVDSTGLAGDALQRLVKSRCDPRELAGIIDTYLRLGPEPVEHDDRESTE